MRNGFQEAATAASIRKGLAFISHSALLVITRINFQNMYKKEAAAG